MRKLTPNHIADSSDEQVGASLLHPASVRIEIDVAHRRPGSQSAHVDLLAIRMDDIHQIGIRRIQSRSRIVILEKRTRRIQTLIIYFIF